MALIKCPECGNQVSNTAATCPHCGAPVAAAAVEAKHAGAPLTTVQETSKKLKLQIIIASVIFWLGFIWAIMKFQADEPPGTAPVVLVLIGMVWYLVTRFRVWWHHK
jgi:uncharacterized membrane protein YvbJ